MKLLTRAKIYFTARIRGKEMLVQVGHCRIVDGTWCSYSGDECVAGGLVFHYVENGCTRERCAEPCYKLKQVTEEEAAVLSL